MSVISTLPRWASVPLQKLAKKEPMEGMQTAQMDQDTCNQFAETAANIVGMTAMDEVEGQDLAMGQPGVVSPQEGLTVRYEGNPSSSSGELKAVVDVTDQGGAMYVRSGPNGFDTIMVEKQGDTVVAQAGFVEQSPLGMMAYIVAGPVS